MYRPPTRQKRLRRARGLPQKALLSWSSSRSTGYEAGSAQPTLDGIRKLARALGVSADSLVFEQDERGPARSSGSSSRPSVSSTRTKDGRQGPARRPVHWRVPMHTQRGWWGGLPVSIAVPRHTSHCLSPDNGRRPGAGSQVLLSNADAFLSHGGEPRSNGREAHSGGLAVPCNGPRPRRDAIRLLSDRHVARTDCIPPPADCIPSPANDGEPRPNIPAGCD